LWKRSLSNYIVIVLKFFGLFGVNGITNSG
jgi:hypothetical protein